jgi:chromate transporter
MRPSKGASSSIVATAAVVLPSLIITTLLARYFFKFEDNIIVRRAMWGLRPVVTGLIASAAAVMALPALLGAESVSQLRWNTLFSGVDIASVIIALLSGVAIIKFKLSPILIIFVAGVVGLVLFGVLGL